MTGLATVALHLHFSFEKWDGFDREYMDRGSATLPLGDELEFEALVTVMIDADGLNIDSVEILPTKRRMYIAELEPDWMSHLGEQEQDDAPEAGDRNGHAF